MDPALLIKIEKLYGYHLTLERKIDGGHLTNNYALRSAERKYFLKEYRFDDENLIVQIHDVKDFFHDGKLPIIMPLAHTEEKRYFIHDKKIHALFPFIIGKHFDIERTSEKSIVQTAQNLAHIHLLSKAGAPKIIEEKNFSWGKEEFAQDVAHYEQLIEEKNHKDDVDRVIAKMFTLKKKIVDRYDTARDDFSLICDHVIHGDYHGENIFYDVDGNVEWIFDIEKASISPRAVEIARSIELLFFDFGFSDEHFDKAKLYLKAYQELYPLSADELAEGIRVWFLHVGHSLWFERQHYQYDNHRLDAIIVKKYYVMQYYYEHLEEYVKRITGFIS